MKHPQTIFGTRMREARIRLGIPQDKFGVQMGLDESTASARISRYETGVHEPPYLTALKIAEVLGVPMAYFYCTEDSIANVLLALHGFNAKELASVCADIENLLKTQKVAGEQTACLDGLAVKCTHPPKNGS